MAKTLAEEAITTTCYLCQGAWMLFYPATLPLPAQALHDLTAARIRGIIRELAASSLAVLADKGYHGAGEPADRRRICGAPSQCLASRVLPRAAVTAAHRQATSLTQPVRHARPAAGSTSSLGASCSCRFTPGWQRWPQGMLGQVPESLAGLLADAELATGWACPLRMSPGARAGARDRILEAGYAVAGQSGVAAVTLDAVANRAGVSKGGLLYHFPSKEALVSGMVDGLCRAFAGLADAAASADPVPVGRSARAYLAASAGELWQSSR
jgi:tetracycline repressor-like protein